jgi:hypothetical protein
MSNIAATVEALVADKKNTRLALATALAKANAELVALRAANSVAQAPAPAPEVTKFEAQLDALRAANSVAPAPAPAASKWIGRPVQVKERVLPAHFAAAREAAMRMGRVVKVVAA